MHLLDAEVLKPVHPTTEMCTPGAECTLNLVEHSSANPKVPGSIPGPVSYRGHGL